MEPTEIKDDPPFASWQAIYIGVFIVFILLTASLSLFTEVFK